MQLSTILPCLFTLGFFLHSVTASPQPNLFPRQQSSSTASSFSSTVTTQCYTSRMTTRLTRAASTTSSTSYVSATSDKSTRVTVTVTAAVRMKTVTSIATVTSANSATTNGIATVTTTSTTLQTTTSSTTITTTTTTTTTVTPTTVATSPGFQPFLSTIPTTSPAPAAPQPALTKRSFPLLSHLNIFRSRQRGGNYPHHAWGHNRPRNYPGDVSCLTILATGTISMHTRTVTSTYTPSPTTSTIATTTTVVSTPRSMSATSTTTMTTYTTSTMTFHQTRYATQTDTTTSTPPGVMPTTYAACTLPANNVTRLTFSGSTANSQPIPLINSDFSTYSGNSTSPYACCVSAIMNPFGAIWAWSASDGCLIFVVQNTGGAAVTQCPAGQMGTSTRKEEVDVGQVGAADDFTLGNANCGAWNYIGNAS